MLRVLLSLMLATGVGVGAAYAQEKEKSNKSKATAEEKFQKLNKAGDGKLTLKEYLAGKKKNKKAAEEAFGAADKDKKGYLTLDEFKTIYPPRHKALTAEEKFKKLNKADDGKLTLEEYVAGKKKTKAAAEEAFKGADKGSKGYLTLDEFKTIYPPPHKALTAEEKFKKLNTAGDGKLTLKEYLVGKKTKDAAEEAFGAADKDKKGYLTLDEFKTIYPRHHKHRKHGGNRVPEKSPELPAEKAADKTPESK